MSAGSQLSYSGSVIKGKTVTLNTDFKSGHFLYFHDQKMQQAITSFVRTEAHTCEQSCM